MNIDQLMQALGLQRAYQAYQQNIGEPFAAIAGGMGRGYLGLDKPQYGGLLAEDMYKIGQAAGNSPIGIPAGAFKAAAQAPELLGLLGAIVPGSKGVSKAVETYGMTHRPMQEAGGASRLHDLVPSFGEDIYTKNALQFFGAGDSKESSVVKIMQKVRNNPDAEVTIYRGVPENTSNAINPGDWVTLDKKVAEEYGPKVLQMKVKAKDITSWPDSLLEFGYYPKE